MKITKPTILIISISILFCGLIAKASEIQPPAAITEGAITSTAITLKWNAVVGASQYEVCSGEQKGENSSSIVTANTLTKDSLTPKTTYYFKIRACDNSVDFNTVKSDCGTPVIGCSEFTSAKKYTTLVSLEDLKASYEKIYKRAEDKVNRYKDYVAEKLTLLSSSSVADFLAEIDQLLGELKNDNTAIQANNDYKAVETAYKEFDSKHDLSGINQKLKAYKILNGYYAKFDQYQKQIANENKFKNQFDSHIAAAKTAYQPYETQLTNVDIKAGVEIDNIYKNLKNDTQYKFTSLIYAQLDYLDKVNEKVSSLSEKIDGYNSLAETDKEKYDALVSSTLASYSNIINSNLWNNKLSYNAVKNIYDQMKKKNAYKNISTVVKGLKIINEILEKAKSNKESLTNAANGTGTVFEDLTAKSQEFYTAIQGTLSDSENKILTPGIDVDKIYQNIKTYQGYKVYGYFYSGFQYLVDLKINKIDVLGSFINDLQCDNSADILAAFNKSIELFESAKNKLKNFPLDKYDAVKSASYPAFTQEAKNSYTKYSAALEMASQCF